MNNKMKDRLDLFMDNYSAIKKDFPWKETTARMLVALLYAQEGRAIDFEAFRQCREIIKQNTGTFSSFRGYVELSLSAQLSMSPNPQLLFAETIKVYGILTSAKFHKSFHLAVAAYQIATRCKETEYEGVANRMRAFYDDMKARHYFQTGDDDYVFAAMLALSDLEIATGAERIEQLFGLIREKVKSKDSAQALAHVLAFSGADDQAASRTLALREAFKAQGIKLDAYFTLSTFGLLALLPAEADTLVGEIIEVMTVLREQKGFGAFSISKEEVFLFAAALVANDYAEALKGGALAATLSSTIANIIFIQEIVIMTIIFSIVAANIAAASAASASQP